MAFLIIHSFIAFFLLYLYFYWKPTIDKTTLGKFILWYNHREEVSIGKFKVSRRFIYLDKYKL